MRKQNRPRTSLSLLFALLLACPVLAQDSLIWTSDLRLGRNDQAVDLMPSSDGFTLRRDQFQDDQLLSFDHYLTSNLTMDGSRDITWPEALGKDARFVGLVNVSGRYLAFFQDTDKKENKHKLYANPLTPDGTWAGKLKTLYEVSFGKLSDRSFNLWLSSDSSHVLVTMSGPFDRDEAEEHTLAVYNQDLEEVWSKRLSLPYSDAMLDHQTFMLDTQLNVHLFTGQDRPKNRQEYQRNQKDGKNHILFSYYWRENTLKELEVAIRKRWITDADAALTPSGLVGIAGFYSDGPYYNSAGSFTLMMDPVTRRVVVKGMVPFTKEFKSEFISEKQVARGREIPDLYLDHLFFQADSSVTIVGEIFDIQERITSDPATGRQIISYTFRYKDILATHMTAEGKVDWTSRIPKAQAIVFEQDIYSGYAVLQNKKGLTFLFNDHPDNAVVKDEIKTLVNLRKVALARVDIRSNGGIRRTHILDQSNEDILFRPALHLALPDWRYVLFAQYKRNYRLGLIDLSERATSVPNPE